MMRWTQARRPADLAFEGEELDRIVRSVATDEAMRELNKRLAAAGLTARLSQTWLDAHRSRTRDAMDCQRQATPGSVLSPEDAERYVAAGVEEARRECMPMPFLPPPAPRRS